uniref:F-box domain-containing protein n=1 Tax=Chromera velia CCMP2878 TaxID=1169474 RepID=A0A0G4FTA2_9ALVE|eukprot:Cvel_18651.t1-p1 / transcript=Cvel_18651.t1 / gene=Cvel_18651 / organism=Chromera_velia_CCMP2878 / gene_product=hypothetical protein / transcript_product=hypothetical protein / location=Cvel_scaffold1558:29979-30629(-) / protein_length=217 / sequence_SO=supercontig / SO=protein_coding / is_pseudo=false
MGGKPSRLRRKSWKRKTEKRKGTEETAKAQEQKSLAKLIAIRNALPFLELPERLFVSRVCRAWRALLPSRDAAVCRYVKENGLSSVIEQQWSVVFTEMLNGIGWISRHVQLEYKGTTPSLGRKFPGFSVMISPRTAIPDEWVRKDGGSDQLNELMTVMGAHRLIKDKTAEPKEIHGPVWTDLIFETGEGKVAFLEVMVGKRALIREPVNYLETDERR